MLAPYGSISQSANCDSILSSINKSQPNQISAEAKRQIRQCIYKIQNKGFVLDEDNCKYDSAKYYVTRALQLWVQMQDTNNQANLLKYLGYLNGRLRRYESGKAQIARAIELFSLKKFPAGIAVSYFDLARLYEYQKKPDSALYFASKSNEHWKKIADTSRMMLTNNYLIYLFSKYKVQGDPLSIINANAGLMRFKKVYWLDELNYYFVCSDYYRSKGDKEKQLSYSQEYKILREMGKKAGHLSSSTYDPSHCKD